MNDRVGYGVEVLSALGNEWRERSKLAVVDDKVVPIVLSECQFCILNAKEEDG